MDVWNYILGYRNTLKSVFETWVVHIPFKNMLFLFVGGSSVSVYKIPRKYPTAYSNNTGPDT